jgi:hypothetical protein
VLPPLFKIPGSVTDDDEANLAQEMGGGHGVEEAKITKIIYKSLTFFNLKVFK